MKKGIILAILGAFFIVGCATLKESKPIILNKEYEKMIAGRLDADYIGTDNCLKACHFTTRGAGTSTCPPWAPSCRANRACPS